MQSSFVTISRGVALNLMIPGPSSPDIQASQNIREPTNALGIETSVIKKNTTEDATSKWKHMNHVDFSVEEENVSTHARSIYMCVPHGWKKGLGDPTATSYQYRLPEGDNFFQRNSMLLLMGSYPKNRTSAHWIHATVAPRWPEHQPTEGIMAPCSYTHTS